MKNLIFLVFLLGCGVDKLSQVSGSKSSAISGNNSPTCTCTSEYHPVCGSSDLKTYENSCLAKCFGNSKWSEGNCNCDSNLLVCGADGNTYTECDAKNNKIVIFKFYQCDLKGN